MQEKAFNRRERRVNAEIAENSYTAGFLGPCELACAIWALVPVRFPTQITGGRFVDRSRYGREVRRDVVLETIFTDVVKQFLHPGNFNHACAAESVERIVGEAPFADVSSHLARSIVGGKTR